MSDLPHANGSSSLVASIAAEAGHDPRYTELHDLIAARALEERIRTAGESLAHFPNRGRPIGDGRRELPSVPPYVLIYRVTADAVSILFVRHGRQQPGGQA